jgi:hypothetical protein
MDSGNPYLSQITDAATQYGVDPTLALGVANQESRFNNKAVSPKGAQGIFQLMPDTAKGLGVDPSDPAQNISGGVRYLKQMQDRYNGDPQLTLAAYNAGPGRVDDYLNKGRPLPAETTDYVNKISGSPMAAPMKQAFAQAGTPSMPDPTQPQAPQPQVPQDPSTLSTLFGGNPTPVGGIGAIARMLGIGSEPNLGRSLQNAGAALQAPGNWGRSGAEGAAAMQNAANAPHFQVVPTADGSRIVIDTRTGSPVSVNGNAVGPGGVAAPAAGPGQTPNAQNAYNEDLAKQSADEMAASQTAYEAAKETKNLAGQARNLVNDPGLSLGASGELRNEAKKYLKQYTGVDLGGVDQSDQFGTLAKTFAANQAKAMGVTRYAGPEIAMASRSSISENNTKEANLQHIADLEHLADRTMAQHEARVAYAKGHNGILGPGFQQSLDAADAATPTYQLNPGMQSAPANRPPLSDIFK